MLVEPGVLGGEHRELHVRRQRGDGHDRAPLGEELRQHGAVAGEDARDLRRLVGLELVTLGRPAS